jgi:hypothetical protein
MLSRTLFPVLFDGGEPAGGGDPAPDGGDPDPQPQPTGGGEPDPKPPWGDDDFDPDRAWKLVQAKEADKERLRQRAEEAEAELKKHADAQKTDQQKLEERAIGAEKKASSAEQEAARLRVVLKKGLTGDRALALAKRLVGESEEDLEADADELLESFKADGGDVGQDPPRRPRERLRPGAAPAAEPDESDPAKLAGQVTRRW